MAPKEQWALPVDGARPVYLLDGSVALAWPARMVCCRPWYAASDDSKPALTHIEHRLFTRRERIVNRLYPARVLWCRLIEALRRFS